MKIDANILAHRSGKRPAMAAGWSSSRPTTARETKTTKVSRRADEASDDDTTKRYADRQTDKRTPYFFFQSPFFPLFLLG